MPLYPHLTFPQRSDRPYCYSNFVETLDGKVTVTDQPDYWPLGSPTDYQTLLELRQVADVLIHGRQTAESHPTLTSLAKAGFQAQRKAQGKASQLPYVIVTAHPGPWLSRFVGDYPVIVATTETAQLPDGLMVDVIRTGTDEVDISSLLEHLSSRGFHTALVEGGPTLLSRFLAAHCLDELFLTLAPRLFGTAPTTLTMVEGYLFPPTQTPHCRLLSHTAVEDELFLRYQISYLPADAFALPK